MKLPTGNEQMIRLHLLSARDLIGRAKAIDETLLGCNPFERRWVGNQKAVREEYLDQAYSQVKLAEMYLR